MRNGTVDVLVDDQPIVSGWQGRNNLPAVFQFDTYEGDSAAINWVRITMPGVAYA